MPFLELGFLSVLEFAAHLPGIFHVVRMEEKNDFILYDAREGVPIEDSIEDSKNAPEKMVMRLFGGNSFNKNNNNNTY